MGSMFGKKKVDAASLVVVGDGERDTRRRNSLAFYITKFMKYEDDDFTELLEAIQVEKANLFNSVNSNARDESK
jgi:hypothetical protein